ncbi:ribosome biosynthesis protein nip7, partial [Bonamia ostreae]
MRQLTEDELEKLFEKLSKYIGKKVRNLVEDNSNVIRLHKEKVFYVPKSNLRDAENVEKKKLFTTGVCLGKFTKTKKFRLNITALPILAEFAKHKIWIKQSSEMSFMYGNNVLKAGIGRMTENTPKYQGVVMLTMNNVPIGFGVTAHSTEECRDLDSSAITVFN